MINIKRFIKEIIGLTVRFSGISFLIREVFFRNKVTVILYHNPMPEIFRKHIDYLSKHYNLISLDKLVSAICNKNWSNIPPKSLVITIDDGFKDNYNLIEIFKKYNEAISIFKNNLMLYIDDIIEEKLHADDFKNITFPVNSKDENE